MAKIGRNDPCHCNSGKKYKKCCMASDDAAALAARPVAPAAVPARLPSLAGYFQEHDELDELTEASNAVVDMVHAPYEPGFEAVFQKLVDRLEAQTDATPG
jgi:hypothetical protein